MIHRSLLRGGGSVVPEGVTVDVIIPLHNGASTIVECLESVCCQSYDSSLITVCIFDDCSDDCSKEVVDSFISARKGEAGGVKFVFGGHGSTWVRDDDSDSDSDSDGSQSGSRGAGFARNEAVKMSNSRVLALLDSDDVMLPERLKTQLDCLFQFALAETSLVDRTVCGCKFYRLPENR